MPLTVKRAILYIYNTYSSDAVSAALQTPFASRPIFNILFAIIFAHTRARYYYIILITHTCPRAAYVRAAGRCCAVQTGLMRLNARLKGCTRYYNRTRAVAKSMFQYNRQVSTLYRRRPLTFFRCLSVGPCVVEKLRVQMTRTMLSFSDVRSHIYDL